MVAASGAAAGQGAHCRFPVSARSRDVAGAPAWRDDAVQATSKEVQLWVTRRRAKANSSRSPRRLRKRRRPEPSHDVRADSPHGEQAALSHWPGRLHVSGALPRSPGGGRVARRVQRSQGSHLMAHQLETEVFYPESDGQPVGETDVHRQLLMDLVFALSRHFADHPDTYVTGNLFLYYVKGNPRQVVCPDVCIAFGSAKRLRNIYQTWRDGPFPQVIIELTSASTRAEDLGAKRELYERLGTLGDYLCDPHIDPRAAEP